jgi:hypothetical protein
MGTASERGSALERTRGILAITASVAQIHAMREISTPACIALRDRAARMVQAKLAMIA